MGDTSNQETILQAAQSFIISCSSKFCALNLSSSGIFSLSLWIHSSFLQLSFAYLLSPIYLTCMSATGWFWWSINLVMRTAQFWGLFWSLQLSISDGSLPHGRMDIAIFQWTSVQITDLRWISFCLLTYAEVKVYNAIVQTVRSSSYFPQFPPVHSLFRLHFLPWLRSLVQ